MKDQLKVLMVVLVQQKKKLVLTLVTQIQNFAEVYNAMVIRVFICK